jgi:hypothetical protein
MFFNLHDKEETVEHLLMRPRGHLILNSGYLASFFTCSKKALQGVVRTCHFDFDFDSTPGAEQYRMYDYDNSSDFFFFFLLPFFAG